jgi:hypothetical protein
VTSIGAARERTAATRGVLILPTNPRVLIHGGGFLIIIAAFYGLNQPNIAERVLISTYGGR